jgi:hypothetical protein
MAPTTRSTGAAGFVGIVECRTNRLSWLPHVEVAHIDEVTERPPIWGRRPPSAA